MRLYRALLRLYPSGFRTEYGADMCGIFQERRRQARGPVAVLGLWLDVVADLFRAALPAHADILRQDLRYAARALNRSRGFAATVVLVAALGIGANTAVFSLTDHVLVRDLPFDRPGELVQIFERTPQYGRMEPSPANFRDWAAQQSSLSAVAAYRTLSVNLVDTGEPARLEGVGLTASMLPMLGTAPRVGRVFSDEDDEPGAPATVILSHALWQARFGGSSSAIGRALLLNDEPHEVIGVMPADFLFPSRETDLWVPMRFPLEAYDDRDDNFLRVVARLGPGVSIEAARDDMTRVTAGLEEAYPVENDSTGATVLPLAGDVSWETRTLLLALVGAALCVLLVACTNLANLMLARIVSRQPEMAVRLSLGAGRERLVRQLLTESVLLSALGGACGVVVGVAILPWLSSLVPTALPIAEVPSLDGRVLALALGLTTMTGIGIGVWPAWRAGSAAALQALRDGARAGSGRGRERLRSALAVVEVAASVALLVVCALLLNSFLRVQGVDPGFRPDQVLTLRTWLPLPKYEETERREQFFDQVLEGARAVPGVTGAAYTSFTPLTFKGGVWPVVITGRVSDPENDVRASLRVVTPAYFSALNIPLIEGRDFERGDRRGREAVAVVSQSFVEAYWPGESPIGRTFDVAFQLRTIVGVVGDVRVRGLEPTQYSEPQVYLPHAQMADGSLPFYVPKDLIVRAAVDPMTLMPALRQVIAAADPLQPVSDVALLSDIVALESEPRGVQLRVVAAFGATALLLAVVGIYGVLAFGVTQRTHEFGVRLALGAQRRDVVFLVLRQTAALAAAGVGVGMAAGYVASRSIESLLVGTAAANLPAYLIVAALAGVTALAAGLVPARRAARVGAALVIRG